MSEATTRAVTLREVEDADLDILYGHQSDPDAAAMANFPLRDRATYLAHQARIRADPAVLTRTVLVGGEVAGSVASFVQDGHREIGYWIGREHWGRGVATRAVALLLELEQRRPLEAWAARHNVASQRVLEKNGFRRLRSEGDEVVYGLAR